MGSPAAVSAVIRSARPTFKSGFDRLAFAVHGCCLVEGYKLVGVGRQAQELEGASQQPEVGVDGWNEQEGEYSFLYADEAGSRSPLFVKCLALDDVLAVQIIDVDKPHQPPRTAELPLAEFTADKEGVMEGYSNIGKLVSAVDAAITGSKPSSKAATAGTATEAAQRSSETAGSRVQDTAAAKRHDPLGDDSHDPLRIGPPRRPSFVGGGVSYPGIGGDDMMPPGFGPGMPRFGPGPGMGGLPGMPGMGGGMHVGPGDPMFQGRMRHPVRPSNLPPGARWDPIAPQGLQGWNPDDFIPGHAVVHPDIAQPGPGRGSDYDHMFG